MARAKHTRSRTRAFYREQQKPENRMLDPEKEMAERREKREQLKSETKVRAGRRAKRVTAPEEEPEGKPEPSPRELAARRRNRLIYAVVLAIFIFFLASASVRAIRVKTQEAAALAREQELAARLAKLEEELAGADTPAYIEEKARTELHMIFPGETLYIVNGRKKQLPE